MFFRACSVEDFDLRRSRAAVLVETLVSDDAGVGRSAPLYPSGTGCERVHTLSRSPGGCSIGKVGFRRNRRAARLGQRRTYFRGWSDETLVPDETGGRRVWNGGAYFFVSVRSKVSTSDEAVVLFWREFWFPTTRAWGALLPYTPSRTGCERVHILSRSPGDVRPETLVSDETGGRRVLNSGAYFSCLFGRRFRPSTKPWGCSGGNFGFRGRRRGALRSPTPPRATGAQTKFWFLTEQAGGAFGAAAHVLPRLFGRRFWFPAGQAGGAYLPRLFECCFGFRENARGVPLGTEAGESHIITSRFRRSFSLQRNACTALFRWTGCERSSHPVAPKNGEFMKFID